MRGKKYTFYFQTMNYNSYLLSGMHSSGVCTTHLLTISQHALHMEEVCLPLVLVKGGYPSIWWGRHPACGQTDICENITFANFVLWAVITLLLLPTFGYKSINIKVECDFVSHY